MQPQQHIPKEMRKTKKGKERGRGRVEKEKGEESLNSLCRVAVLPDILLEGLV